MRGPNNEQKLAIEHNGGVLLKAGAGSGKTFVLVEHIVYLTKNFIFKDGDELAFQSEDELQEKLRKYYSKIVLMTFTNKAAGELSIRLSARLSYELENFQNKSTYNPWSVAIDCLPYMTVGTIHGFCFKLIKQGIFSDISPDALIISQSQFEYYIEELFNDWLGLQDSDEFLDIIRANTPSIIKAMQGVFSDPLIRLNWEEDNSFYQSDKDLFEEIEKLSKFSNIHSEQMNLDIDEKYKKTKWYEFLNNFLAIRGNPIEDLGSFEVYKNFFDGIKRMPPAPRKPTGLDDIIDYFSKIKEFRAFYFNKSEENFIEYFKNKDGLIASWVDKLKSIFNFINFHYKELNGLTFSDLEYIVYKGMKSAEQVEKVSQMYEYFIIDEFQDTSSIQFDIVSKIIKNDFTKIFCVGDEKQAIYGFRGGELGVFWECASKVEQVLTLKNNYRSLPNIVKFNNKLFDDLFKLGLDFEGQDLMSVDVVHQEIPEGVDYKTQGSISKLITPIELEEKESLLTEDIHFLEARNIYEYLESKDEIEQTCILYKNLKPSRVLIEYFIKKGKSFTAQIKIPFEEEPIIGIFYTMIGEYLDKAETSMTYLSFIINGHLRRLNIMPIDSISTHTMEFFKNISFLGIKCSFDKFIFDMGLSNSNSRNNISHIHNLIDTTATLEELFLKLKENASLKFSMDFQFGDKPENIIIMTVHSSKGLEFPEVILGGIQTNANRNMNRNLFGKLPGSFRWFISSEKRKALKTPQFYYEELLTRHKEFAETKRLFYVAGTRARNKIIWFDFDPQNGKSLNQKNSWGQGLETWSSSNEDLFETQKTPEISFKNLTRESSEFNFSSPLFHKHDIGIFAKQSEPLKLIFTPELSVTKLAHLSECPRKFYLSNTVKLNESFLNELSDIFVDVDLKQEEETEQISFHFKSSAERGTKIHELISYAILNNWVLPREEFNGEYFEPSNWALTELAKYKSDFQFISEVPLKFSFFGHIISGIPDLVLLSDKSARIWDFKTGSPKESKEVGYYFQLKSYALALYETGKVPKKALIELSLCYVDVKELKTIKISYDQVRDELFTVWQRMMTPDVKNLEFCSDCGYKKLCHFNRDSIAP